LKAGRQDTQEDLC